VEPVKHFDEVFAAISGSRVYREAVHASRAGLPEWLVPFSVTNLADLERIALEIGVGPNETFVDLGCGSGGPTLWMAERTGATGVGVDFSSAAVSSAVDLAVGREMTGRVRFVVADAADTALPAASFDGAFSIDALMFVDPHAVAREIARLLKPGGVMVMRATVSLGEPFLPTLVRDYRPVFEAAGFVVSNHGDVDDYDVRSIAFFRALRQRAAALRAEIGPAASLLLDEATAALAKTNEAPRVRTQFMAVQKGGRLDLETQRLRLEALSSRHADAMFPILRDRSIYRYMPDTMPASIHQLRERYVWLARGASPDGAERWLNWIVFPRAETTPAGFLQATILGRDAWVGYVLNPAMWKRGYAREALRAVVDFLTRAGVRRVMASIDPANVASRGVVEALDFRIDDSDDKDHGHLAEGGDVVYVKAV
jgi:RimJ/RimL family protein N-acetyltransferase/ubiquinone/menaquinone biosynthesis C-methylase UbiE